MITSGVLSAVDELAASEVVILDLTKTGVVRVLRAAMLSAVAAIVGCGDGDGAAGSGGTAGSGATGGVGGSDAAGGTGGTGNVGGTVDLSDPGQLEDLVQQGDPLLAEITDVTVSSPPVMTFRLSAQDGRGATGLAEVPGARVYGTFAKLVPGESGEPSRWESYINRIVRGGPSAALGEALQADQDQADLDALQDNGNGNYVWTYSTDVTNVTDPVSVSWEPSFTTRAGLEIRVHDVLDPDNPTLDFVPDGSTGLEKRISTTQACNECHVRLASHDGPRFTADYCVTCHTLGTRDPDFGQVLDMAYMTHAIHASAFRAALDDDLDFIVGGDGGTVNDFSKVTYPQDVRSSPDAGDVPCETCHRPSDDAPQGNAWAETVSSTACGGCHADRLVVGEPDPITGLSAYETEHRFTDPPLSFPDSSCRQCHNSSAFDPPIDTDSAHALPAIVGREAFRFEILGAIDTDAGELPSVTFRVVNPADANRPYDLSEPDGPFDSPEARLTVLLAWPSSDYTNRDTGSEVPGSRPGAPAQNVSMDALSSCVPPSTSCSDDGDGRYTIMSPVPVASDLTGGSLTVALEGGPAVDGVMVLVDSAVEHFAISAEGGEGVGRDPIVGIDRCNRCHSILSFHDGSTNSIELCVTCHNANATDIRARAEAGAPGETSINFKRMVHGIHNATDGLVIYGVGGTPHDYSEVTYPGRLHECNSCHEGETFYPTDPDETLRFATTTVSDNFTDAASPDEVVPTEPGTPEREATLANQEDDFNITPNTAACTACHTSESTVMHAVDDGRGFVSVKQNDDGSLQAPPNETEVCDFCHGPGRNTDTATIHIPPFDGAGGTGSP